MTDLMRGKLVEVEVAGLELGDQIEAESLPVNGVTYEQKKDTLYLYAEPEGGHLEHSISSPREIFVELGPTGVSQVVVIDPEGHKQFIRFRAPLELPAAVELHPS